MLLNQILAGNDKQTIEDKGFLEITANSVRLEDNVYQFCNVTGFGVAEIKTKGISFSVLTLLFLLTLIIGSIPTLVEWSWLPLSLLGAAIIYNASRPKFYGLSIYLNSGNEKTFITKDIEFLQRVVRALKEFIENPKQGQVINVTIGRDVKGSITFGNVNNM